MGRTDGGTWITDELIHGYLELHRLGWAHSVEVWEGEELVGGIYGIAVGGFFSGESMFHRRTDASKVAFFSLAWVLREAGFSLFDVQVPNAHLMSLGCVTVSRAEYLGLLGGALAREVRPLDQVVVGQEGVAGVLLRI